MKKIGLIFNSFPHSISSGREGLDFLFSVSAYCNSISVFFIGDAVSQLVSEQKPQKILSRDYISAFKIMELYEINNIYLCKKSLIKLGFQNSPLIIKTKKKTEHELAILMNYCDQLVVF
ncbi:protein TusC [Candidatus Photodesmus katoptron]|uniref:Protein TusC homolog n=1 Tax=Candidatus Photodesmus katoptron Akat1 TaxID=1236703 RepID=S3E1D7_9GAMM|nr:sulfurtransferase complex subunit TusC [Candidatus Photodesmus katoptron]EPE37996.1 protein TusC [Candidatus Photodesmus katoptron Akat1]KEY90737.1 protein TusC [Candidatus Photodesmus katoptron]